MNVSPSVADEEDDRFNKAERLAIAGQVAPSLRSVKAKMARRRVGLLNKTGEVTGYTTLDKVPTVLLGRAGIEMATHDGVRPKESLCLVCGFFFDIPKRGKAPRVCKACVRGEALAWDSSKSKRQRSLGLLSKDRRRPYTIDRLRERLLTLGVEEVSRRKMIMITHSCLEELTPMVDALLQEGVLVLVPREGRAGATYRIQAPKAQVTPMESRPR
jgi:hypothetical protein